MGESAHSYVVPAPFAGPCPNGVPRGGVLIADAHFGDLNLNIPWSSGTSFAVGSMSKGTASITPGLLDGYGFEMERRLIDANSSQGQGCNPSAPPSPQPICVWRVLFGAWGPPWTPSLSGYVGPITINGAPASDTTACADVLLPVSSTVQNVTLTIYLPGSIQ